MSGTGPRTPELALWILALGCLAAGSVQASPQSEWNGVERVVAIGDVHGSYQELLTLLAGTGLVSPQLGWIGGQDHLVLVGDLVDRGPDDRAVLDLVRRLQREAQTAGGRVHALLGNHEVMNMVGDLRYVSEKGFRDFLDEEQRRDRNQALQRFRNTVGPGLPLSDVRMAFEERFPPGYFARQRAFWFGGEYGDWLRQQPAVIKINGVVFLHGGLTEQVAELGLDAINQQVHESIIGFMENAQSLVELTGAPPSYVDAMRTAKNAGEGPGARSKRAALAQSVLQFSQSISFVPAGPLWYRGGSLENERLERLNVERSLEDLQARAMVIAHTPTGSGRISSRFNDRVYRVDVGMAYGRAPLALVFEGERVMVFDPATQSFGLLQSEPPQGEGWSRFSEQLHEDQLEPFLREASVTSCEMIQRGVRYAEVCELERGELRLRTVFQTVDELPGEVAEEPRSIPRTYRNEIAAYRLDRILGLGLVPLTVERTIDGRTGSLQIWLEAAVDLPLLKTYNQLDLLDGLEREIMVANAFRSLIDIQGQAEMGKMLLPQEKRIALADSTKAFSLSADLNPELMPSPCGPIPPDRRLFLQSISQQDLQAELGDYLSLEQIQALLARRNGILDACSGPAAQRPESPAAARRDPDVRLGGWLARPSHRWSLGEAGNAWRCTACD